MKRAFTLIELLVVIAIIAILAAILFPVFAQAKGAAKKTACLASLKQISTAWVLYNDTYDDTLMRTRTGGDGRWYYWWGSYDGTTLRPEEGLLYPYMRSKELQVDPVFPSHLRGALGQTGFGYNYAYLSPSSYEPPTYEEVPIPVSGSQVESTSETLVFATSARINNWSYPTPTLEGNTYIDPPSYDYPGVHGRHGGGQAVLVWADTHGSSKRPDLRQSDFGYGYFASDFRANNLGDLLRPGCPLGSACQDYYFALAKPQQ
jgi:prepilin-type N-terminal cleavage/methylation domain-containing protein